MPGEDERLERLARIIEASADEGTSFAAMDVDAHRETLGRDFAELEDLVEVERVLESYMEPPDSVRLPRDLGAYRLTREVGRGGMGVVYEAVRRGTDKRVAVKVLRLGYVGRADARARFRREAKALARVRHPNIVDFIEADEVDEQPFYVMSLIEGMSLDAALEGSHPPNAQHISAGLADIADALQRLHEAGLVHRDLKPSNVVLADDGRMVLADFGLATADDFLTVTRTGDALGTPAYMAPEQVLGKRGAVDARSDIYGLGATLYYALTRHAPFEATDAHGLATAILAQRPEAPSTHAPDVPPALAKIALKALEKDAGDRYRSAGSMREDLRAFAEGRPVRGRPVSTIRRTLRRVGKHRRLLTVSLALFAAGVIYLLLAPSRQNRVPDPDAPLTLAHGEGLLLPGPGRLYHGVFPGDDESIEDANENGVTLGTLRAYERAVGKKAAWVYFAHNWYQGRTFPLATATWIRANGAVPFIRLMLVSAPDLERGEPLFTPARIAAGEFDRDLEAWGQAAAAFGTPLLVEFGTAVNGSWSPWNGLWHGGAGVGPEAFKRAFRHIVRVVSASGAKQVSWVFHFHANDVPDVPWNRFEGYYPGDDVVDWVGVSIRGVASAVDPEWSDFADDMNEVYPRIVAMAPGKPIAVVEFAASGGNPLGTAGRWAGEALESMLAGTWPALVGFAWWSDYWETEADPPEVTDMRVSNVPGLASAMASKLRSDDVLNAPILSR